MDVAMTRSSIRRGVGHRRERVRVILRFCRSLPRQAKRSLQKTKASLPSKKKTTKKTREKKETKEKEITAKYPDIFKDFPHLRFAYFRDHQFSQIFPTVQEARETVEKVEYFNKLEDELITGNPATLIKSMKEYEEDPKVLEKFGRNFLGNLYEVDKGAYVEVTMPIMKNICRQAIAEGKRTNNINLENSGHLISKQIWGTMDPPPDARRVEEDPEKEALKKKLEERDKQDKSNFRVEVRSSIDKSIIGSITKGLDPKNILSPRMKQLLVNDIIGEVDEQLAKTPGHLKFMDGLWAQARKAGYDRSWVARLVNAYLARAKPILSSVRDKALKETMGKMGGEESPTPGQGGKPPTRRNFPAGGGAPPTRTTNNLPKDAKQVDWKNTSDDDIIAGKAVLRK